MSNFLNLEPTDPLATIQVNPQQKKSKNKSEEIYAVSRWV